MRGYDYYHLIALIVRLRAHKDLWGEPGRNQWLQSWLSESGQFRLVKSMMARTRKILKVETRKWSRKLWWKNEDDWPSRCSTTGRACRQRSLPSVLTSHCGTDMYTFSLQIFFSNSVSQPLGNIRYHWCCWCLCYAKRTSDIAHADFSPEQPAEANSHPKSWEQPGWFSTIEASSC